MTKTSDALMMAGKGGEGGGGLYSWSPLFQSGIFPLLYFRSMGANGFGGVCPHVHCWEQEGVAGTTGPIVAHTDTRAWSLSPVLVGSAPMASSTISKASRSGLHVSPIAAAPNTPLKCCRIPKISSASCVVKGAGGGGLGHIIMLLISMCTVLVHRENEDFNQQQKNEKALFNIRFVSPWGQSTSLLAIRRAYTV